jgi:hypothetical protein
VVSTTERLAPLVGLKRSSERVLSLPRFKTLMAGSSARATSTAPATITSATTHASSFMARNLRGGLRPLNAIARAEGARARLLVGATRHEIR